MRVKIAVEKIKRGKNDGVGGIGFFQLIVTGIKAQNQKVYVRLLVIRVVF